MLGDQINSIRRKRGKLHNKSQRERIRKTFKMEKCWLGGGWLGRGVCGGLGRGGGKGWRMGI